MSPGLRRGWLRRWRFPLLWTFFLLAIGLATNVYLALRPASLRAVITKQLSSALLVPVELGECSFGITRGIEIRDLRVHCPHHAGAQDTQRLLAAPSIQIKPSYGALLMGKLRLRELIVREPRLFIHRAADGSWNLDGLVAESGEGPTLELLRLHGAKVTYSDESSREQPLTQVAEDLELAWAQDADGAVRLRGNFTMVGVSTVLLEGDLVTDKLGWRGSLRVGARKVDLERHAGLLTRAGLAGTGGLLRGDSLRGFVDADVVLRLESGGIHLETVAGSLVGGSAALASPLTALTNLSCGFTYADSRVGVTRIAADLERASLTGALELQGLGPGIVGSVDTWTAHADLLGVAIDDDLLGRLPEDVRRWVDEVEPGGTVDLSLDIAAKRFPPLPEECSLTIRLDGVSVHPPRFPYAFENLHGEVLIEGERLTIPVPIRGVCSRLEADFTEERTETTIQLVGTGLELAAGGEIDLTAKVENVPIDERARSLLPAKGRPIWDHFQLLGQVDGTVTLSRPPRGAGGEPGDLRVTATALSDGGVRMSYVGFPYPMTEIAGKATYDTKTKRLVFIDLKGKHDDRVVLGSGIVEFGSPTRLKIDLHSDELIVEPDLVAALPEKARRLLADFGVEGRLITDVSIHSTNDRGVEVATDVQIIEGAVTPRQFPYRLELGAGNLKLLGAHTMEFNDVRTPAGYTPSVLFNGGLVSPGIERELSFKFEASKLPFDEKLMTALPEDLRSFAESFGLRGTFEGIIEGQYIFRDDDPSAFRVLYHGDRIRTRDAEVDFGLKLRRMIGEGALVGRKEPGKPHYFLGKVLVDSALFNRLELTHGEVQFAYGTEHEAVGAARAGDGDVEGYIPPPWMVARLSPDKVRNTFQMLVHSSDVYGGQVDGFGYVDGGVQHDIGGHLVGEGLELGLAAEDIFGVSGTNTTGQASGNVTFSGRTGDLESLRGNGEGVIRNARLVELPLFFGILSLLFGDGSDRQFFREVLLKFGIQEGKFVAGPNGIDLRSQALKLRGSGDMDFQGRLDLTLKPRFFSLEIPGLEQLFSLLKQGLAQVLIRGTLNEPEVALATAGGLVEFDLDVSEDENAPKLPSDQRRSPRAAE